MGNDSLKRLVNMTHESFRVTIPKRIVEFLQLKKGDMLEFVPEEETKKVFFVKCNTFKNNGNIYITK